MTCRMMPISEHVVEKVAADTGQNPVDLPPIYDSIEPDALDSLIDSMSEGEIRFRYAGLTIIVGYNGTIDLVDAPVAAEDSPSTAPKQTD